MLRVIVLLTGLLLAVPAIAGNHGFGDSVGNGYGCGSLTPNGCTYAAEVRIKTGQSWTNHAVNGSQQPEVYDQVFKTVTSASDNYFVEDVNDDRIYGTDANKRENFKRALGCNLYYLAGSVTKASNFTFTGTWYSPTASGTDANGKTGKFATGTVGDTATTTFSGDVLAFCYYVQNNTPGSFKVTVDNVDVATFNTSPPASVTTLNGKINSAALGRLTGFGAGSHTVKFTNLGPSNGATILEWVWQGSSGAHVYLLNIPYRTAASYASLGSSSANIDAYNTIESDLVTQAQNAT